MATKQRIRKNGQLKDKRGYRQGRLVVVEIASMETLPPTWRCRCDCGNVVEVLSNRLFPKNVKNLASCGCLHREVIREKCSTHGKTNTPMYRVYRAMIRRCENRNTKDWKRYGARGIKVCERWRTSFENFISDMGERPSENHSIDRIDNDGNYEPSNCRWATAKEQNRNKRTNRIIEHEGERLCLKDWASKTGLCDSLIHQRLNSGWTVAEALTTPALNPKLDKDKYHVRHHSVAN